MTTDDAEDVVALAAALAEPNGLPSS